MKNILFGAAALALMGGCASTASGPSPEIVTAALADMGLATSGTGFFDYATADVSPGTAIFTKVTTDLGNTDLVAERLVLTGLNMTNLGATFSSMTFENILIADPDDEGELKIASLTVVDPSPALAAWISDLVESGEPAAPPALSEISFETAAVNGFTFELSDDMELEFNFGQLAMNGFDQGALQNFSFDQVFFTLDDDSDDLDLTASLGSIDVDGWKQTQTEAMVGMMGAFASGSEDEALAGLSGIMSNPLDPGYNAASLIDLNVDVNGLSASLPSLIGTVDYDSDGNPVVAETEPFTLTVTADPKSEWGGATANILNMVGMDNIELTGASKTYIDVDTDRVSGDASDNYLKIADVADFNFGIDLVGVGAYNRAMVESGFAGADGDFEALFGALSSIELNGFELGIDDNGLLDKSLTLAAAFSGQDADVLMAQLQGGVAFLPALSSEIGIDPAILGELAGALATYLSDPNTLTFTLAPPEPITMELFSDPGQITKEALGFSATAE